MNFVLQDSRRVLVSLSTDELLGIKNALKEVCLSTSIAEETFQARLGVTRESLSGLLHALGGEVHASRQADELVNVWVDQGIVMVRVLSVFGDPVEMNETEAADFSEKLRQAMSEASQT